jgi:hypothetical protein
MQRTAAGKGSASIAGSADRTRCAPEAREQAFLEPRLPHEFGRIRVLADSSANPRPSTEGTPDGTVPVPGARRLPVLGLADDSAEQEADRMASDVFGLRGGIVRASAPEPVQGRARTEAEMQIAAATRAPGRPLPPGLGDEFGKRFAFDFTSVRIHDGAEAARTARIVGADAYSLGANIAFADGRYDPGTTKGQALLAHELAHVVQQSRGGGRPVIRRSLAGALIGAGIGAVAGGVLFGALGSLAGPAGAAIGGVLGALGGAALGGWLGDKVSSDSRPLSQPEKDAAKLIFRESLNMDSVSIRRGSFLSGGDTARTSGNTINLPDSYFTGKTLNLTPDGSLTLIHELVHVWQYQHGGFSYIESSLVPQAVAGSRGMSRNVAYDWRNADGSGIPWERWNAEDQAECISDYNAAGHRIEADQYPSPPNGEQLADIETVTRAEPYLAKLRAGVGAPGSKPEPKAN